MGPGGHRADTPRDSPALPSSCSKDPSGARHLLGAGLSRSRMHSLWRAKQGSLLQTPRSPPRHTDGAQWGTGSLVLLRRTELDTHLFASEPQQVKLSPSLSLEVKKTESLLSQYPVSHTGCSEANERGLSELDPVALETRVRPFKGCRAHDHSLHFLDLGGLDSPYRASGASGESGAEATLQDSISCSEADSVVQTCPFASALEALPL